MTRQIRMIHFFYYPDNGRAVFWEKKIKRWLKDKWPKIKFSAAKPDAVIALGGDGTILEATRKYQKDSALIVGLNLGRIGFLASVRKEINFISFLNRLFQGKFRVNKRITLSAEVWRKNKKIFATTALNEVTIQSPISLVEVGVKIEDHTLQHVRGTGIMVSTPTGSTAYNLSANGPIVMPNIKCFILTEIHDYGLPTPSVVIKRTNKITLTIEDFREKKVLNLNEGEQYANVLLVADGETIFPLEKGDKIKIGSTPRLVKFAEFENT